MPLSDFVVGFFEIVDACAQHYRLYIIKLNRQQRSRHSASRITVDAHPRAIPVRLAFLKPAVSRAE
jgi:hypothetical protein